MLQKSTIENLVKDYLAQNIHVNKIAVACSAGIDSMVLLDILSNFDKQIFCLHVDHAWREDSGLAVNFLRDFCENKKIEFQFCQLNSPKITEDEGRKARYDFFENFCKSNNIQDLFLAHNLNDHIETIIFRLFRGTNTLGLIGIQTNIENFPGLKLHRPLLTISRDEINIYAKDKELEFIEDSSNQDLRFARNRIRHQIIPEALLINPQILNNIGRLSLIIKEEQEYFSRIRDRAIADLGPLPWSLFEFKKLEKIIQRKILEQIFTTKIDFVNLFLEAIDESAFCRINFEKAKYFTIKQKQIHLEQDTM